MSLPLGWSQEAERQMQQARAREVGVCIDDDWEFDMEAVKPSPATPSSVPELTEEDRRLGFQLRGLCRFSVSGVDHAKIYPILSLQGTLHVSAGVNGLAHEV